MRSVPNFSDRTSWNLDENDLSRAVRSARSAGKEIVDLTRSNPTECGFQYGDELLSSLQNPDALQYDPQPLGLLTAREAVAHYYADHGAAVPADHICLTTSTSEAYSFLFRLLCNPGDEVLVAAPSYPLFAYLTQLDDVVLREYPLHYDPNADAAHSWSIDLAVLEAAITPRCRAVVLVHPNNPTGNFVSAAERESLIAICVRHGLALLVDEVFLDHGLSADAAKSFAAGASSCMCFVLSGISKICALPQMKASWIAATGPLTAVAEAMARIEVIADTFLSMNAPVQLALPTWLEARHGIQRQVLDRLQSNLAALDEELRGTQGQRLQMQGGWTAVVRVPRTVDGLPFAMAALERGVLVQPGEFYGLSEGRIVLSLLTPPEIWRRGIALLPIRG